jgi:protein TonB
MSYLNRAQDPARKATALTATIAVHAVIAVILVTGLRYTGIIETVERKPIIEFKTPPEPPPPEPDKVVPDPPKAPDFVAPQPPVEFTDVAPIRPRVLDPTDIPQGPVVPVPQPGGNFVEPPRAQPSFAPRGAAPRGDTSRWVTTQDYPAASLRRGSEGTTHFRVVVGSDGRVDACEVTRSSGDVQLDAAVCKNVERRARFEPATDGNGQKAVGTYTSRVTWQIPD